jgi:hypothetical protein
MISFVIFFLREIFTANAASPPVDTEPATINPTVVKQNGHIVHLSFFSPLEMIWCALVMQYI